MWLGPEKHDELDVKIWCKVLSESEIESECSCEHGANKESVSCVSLHVIMGSVIMNLYCKTVNVCKTNEQS